MPHLHIRDPEINWREQPSLGCAWQGAAEGAELLLWFLVALSWDGCYF